MKQDEYTAACSRHLAREGYRNAEVKTGETILAEDAEGGRVCFRCVHTGWSRAGELDVEELISLMNFYGADRGVLLTNGRFTLGARLRARQEGNITLIPRFRPDDGENGDFEALL